MSEPRRTPILFLLAFIACSANPLRAVDTTHTAGAAVGFGDLDNDGDVDLDDLTFAADCLNLSGPGTAAPLECQHFDAADDDFDLHDFAALLLAHSGWMSVPTATIPGGDYQMGDANSDGPTTELPRHWVRVESFVMDQFEVTNKQYADALNWAASRGDLIVVVGGVVRRAGGGVVVPYCNLAESSPFSRITWDENGFAVMDGFADHPMADVSWYGAAAYANWRSAVEGRAPAYDTETWACDYDAGGYRLPTEAEWEYAARGGVVGMRFPWSDSNEIQHARANYFSSPNYVYDTSPTRRYHPTFDTRDFPLTSPVGYFAPNDYGLFDMAGNVDEWCNDWYSPTYYSVDLFPDPPHGPATGTNRVLRGGSWTDNAAKLRCSARAFTTPDNRLDFFGIRLVRTPQ